MARGGLARAFMLVSLSGCIAPAATIGAVDQDGSGGGSAGVSTGSTGSTGSAEASGDSTSTTSPAGCEPACVAFHDCQQARCRDGECVVSFLDALCEPGKVCGPLGCEASPLACDDPSILVCEGFEEEGFSASWSGGSIMRSKDPLNSGLGAGWVTVGPDEREQLQLNLDPPMDEGLLAIRAFVWLPAADTVETWAILFEIFGSTDAGTERFSLDLRPQAGLMFVNLLSPEANVIGNDLLTPGAWSCVELRVQISQGQGEVEVRVDDVPVLGNGPGIDTVPVEGVANIEIGGIGSPSHSGVTAYGIDDIVVATAPIGCDIDP